jgi:hypothetical protein
MVGAPTRVGRLRPHSRSAGVCRPRSRHRVRAPRSAVHASYACSVSDAAQNHDRVLRDAARSVLGPLGLTQRGRSRTWLDDRIWHVIVVEFQPSSWSRGTYVNVAAMWLWNPKDYFSFDYGPYRVQGFESADEAQWPERCRAAATVAADRVAKLQGDLIDIGAAARHLSSHPDAGWPTFHAAVASGLAGGVGRARALAKKVLREDDGVDWHREMKARVLEYSGLFDDPPEYRARIVAEIQQTRALLNLPDRSAAEIDLSIGSGSTTRRRSVLESLARFT